jgi:hypothetical protein
MPTKERGNRRLLPPFSRDAAQGAAGAMSDSPPHGEGLVLRLLGEIEVEKDGTALALPPSKKTRALLAYLAVVRRP